MDDAHNIQLDLQIMEHHQEIYDVMAERLRQLNKFGPQNRPPSQWFLILAEEFGEVAKECVEMEFDDAKHPHADPDRYYKELVETVAVGLAALQNYNQRKLTAENERKARPRDAFGVPYNSIEEVEGTAQ